MQQAQTHIWKGDLRISGYQKALAIPCIAVPYNNNGMVPSELHTTSWPKQLFCDSLKLKSASQISNEVNQSGFYVRFVPIDPFGKEIEETKLDNISAILMERALVFEVPCMESENRGTLYLWSIHTNLGRYALIGGFKSSAPT